LGLCGAGDKHGGRKRGGKRNLEHDTPSSKRIPTRWSHGRAWRPSFKTIDS
jgi:hypothetical protein